MIENSFSIFESIDDVDSDFDYDDFYIFDFYEIVVNVFQRDAKKHEFDIFKRRFKKIKITKQINYIELICDRSITYKKREDKKIKNVNTIKIVCFWKMILKSLFDNERWKIIVKIATHNHSNIKTFMHSMHRHNELIEKMFRNIAIDIDSNMCSQMFVCWN